MSATHELLDKVRAALELGSDAALARKFGLTAGAVSNYRQGTRHPEPETIDALARAVGESPIAWALRVQAEREAKINPRRAQVWLRWSKQVAGFAAVALLMGSFGRLDVRSTPLPGGDSLAHNPPTLSIMSNLTRWARSLHAAAVALLARLHGGAQHGPSPAAA